MITVPTWLLAFMAACAALCVVLAFLQLWRMTRPLLMRWRHRLAAKRCEALRPFVDKLVRHVKTGRVGLCLGVGTMNSLSARLAMEVCFCPECVKRMQAAMESKFAPLQVAALMSARMGGHTSIVPAGEITIAPAADAAAFRAKVEEANPEGMP